MLNDNSDVEFLGPRGSRRQQVGLTRRLGSTSLFWAAVALLRLWSYWPFPRGRHFASRLVLPLIRRVSPSARWVRVQGIWFWTDLREFDVRQAVTSPRCDDNLQQVLLQHLPQGGVFVDVGANIGRYALLASHHVGDSGQILAIEPNPTTANLLARNLGKNGVGNATVVQIAITDAQGIAELFIGADTHTGKASLSSTNARTNSSVTVTCSTLDAVLDAYRLPRLDVLKIDVEGAELRVLKGMDQSLQTFHPTLVIEIEPKLLESFGATPADIHDFLKARGYQGSYIDPTNAVFLPQIGQPYLKRTESQSNAGERSPAHHETNSRLASS